MADNNIKKIDSISTPIGQSNSTTDAPSKKVPDTKFPIQKDTTKPTQNIPGVSPISEDDPYEEIKKEIATRFELLPKNIQEIIIGDKYQMDLFEITKENKLTYEELSVLALETTMVLLGMTKPEEYRDELQVELKKNDPEIDALVTSVNKKIFDPLKSSLERIYAAKKSPEEALNEERPKDEIPLAQVEKEVPTEKYVEPKNISSEEKNLLEKTGVILNDTPAETKIIKDPIMPERNDILKEIETPTKTPTGGIVADKLMGTNPMPQTKTTDYSMPKTTATTPETPKTSADPHREPIQ